MKIALVFYGLTRSLTYTQNSIHKNIINVFKNNNIDYDIYMHTYNLNSYENKRARETKDDFLKYYDKNEYKFLKPNYLIIDNQDKIKESLNLKDYRTKKEPSDWNDNYTSVDNFILSQYSKYKITSMVEKNINQYKYIIFIRPDCLYYNKFSIRYFDNIDNNTIAVPKFHLYGKHGRINDRFAICNPHTYKIYGTLFTELLVLSKEHELHSESILGFVLKKNNIKWTTINFKFSRVRFGGKITNGDKFNYTLKNITLLPYN